jgi:hypothetical protein
MGKLSLALSGFAMAVLFSTVCIAAETFQYDAHGNRDPLVPLVGQEKPGGVLSLAEIVSADDIKLEGIAGVVSGRRMAIINGELVKEGFKAGEIEVKSIAKNSVLIAISGREYTINLPEEGGLKK